MVVLQLTNDDFKEFAKDASAIFGAPLGNDSGFVLATCINDLVVYTDFKLKSEASTLNAKISATRAKDYNGAIALAYKSRTII